MWTWPFVEAERRRIAADDTVRCFYCWALTPQHYYTAPGGFDAPTFCSVKHREQYVADHAAIAEYIEQGHSRRCACRLVWGDGACECQQPALEVVEVGLIPADQAADPLTIINPEIPETSAQAEAVGSSKQGLGRATRAFRGKWRSSRTRMAMSGAMGCREGGRENETDR